MQHAMWLASVFGPLLVILGVWMIFYRDKMHKVLTSVKSNPGTLYVLGLLNLILGLVIVNCYNMWVADISVLVTLLGWVMIIRGLVCFFAPHMALKFSMKGKKVGAWSFVTLVWGLLLCWFAFWM